MGAKEEERKNFVEPREIRVFRVWFSTLSIQQGLQEFWCSSWPRRPVIGRKEQGEQAKTLAGFGSCFGQIFGAVVTGLQGKGG